MFRTAFFETIGNCSADSALAGAIWKDIADRYSAAGRHYHNLNHLDSVARELLAVRSRIDDWDAVVLALAYHDIIYSTLKGDNEAASAEYAREKLAGALPPDRLQRITELILATQAHEPGDDPDTAYFTGADLAILGAPPALYQQYAGQIRQEYRHYPDNIYRPGRKSVLQHLRDMPRIFRTDEFYAKYEEQARENLRVEMERLSG